MSKLVITIDLDRSGVPEGSGMDREEAISLVRTAFFFTPFSYHIEEEES